MDVIEISGTRYIKAGDIARKMGYTADYVGQLCRAGKVNGRRIGKAWYVEEHALDNHKQGTGRSNKQKTVEDLEERLFREEYERGRIHQSLYTPPHRARILETPISYQPDKHPLFPEPKAKHIEVDIEDGRARRISLDLDNDENTQLKDVEEPIMGRNESRFEPVESPRTLAEGVLMVQGMDDDEDAGFQPLFNQREDTPTFSGAGYAPQRQSHHEHLELAPRPIMSLVPVATILAGLVFVCASVFLQNVWVYGSGDGTISERPRFETSFGITAMSTVIHAISR